MAKQKTSPKNPVNTYNNGSRGYVVKKTGGRYGDPADNQHKSGCGGRSNKVKK